MTRLVPYAGYDPDEDDFSSVAVHPRFCSDDWYYNSSYEYRPRQPVIDPAVVRIVRAAGLPYRVVGELVAEVYRRRMPYTALHMYKLGGQTI